MSDNQEQLTDLQRLEQRVEHLETRLKYVDGIETVPQKPIWPYNPQDPDENDGQFQ